MLKKLFGKLFKVHITAFLKHSEAFYKGLILTWTTKVFDLQINYYTIEVAQW